MNSPDILEPLKRSLQILQDMASKATPKPWMASPPDEFSKTHCIYETHEDDPPIIECWNWQEKENARFCAAARSFVPAMITGLQLLITLLEGLQASMEEHKTPGAGVTLADVVELKIRQGLRDLVAAWPSDALFDDESIRKFLAGETDEDENDAEPAFDQMQANAEGWGVFSISDQASEIQRLDDGATDDGNGIPVFAGDKEAEAYVMGKAQQGSVYHQQALYLVGQHRDWGTPPVFSQDPRDQGTPEPPAGGWPG